MLLYFFRYGTDTSEMLIEDVACSSNTYLALSQCSITHQYSTFCNNHNNDVVVSCCEFRKRNNYKSHYFVYAIIYIQSKICQLNVL